MEARVTSAKLSSGEIDKVLVRYTLFTLIILSAIFYAFPTWS